MFEIWKNFDTKMTVFEEKTDLFSNDWMKEKF